MTATLDVAGQQPDSPGHSEEEVAENTGWEIVRSAHFVELEPPSAAELHILRTAIDRKGVLRK